MKSTKFRACYRFGAIEEYEVLDATPKTLIYVDGNGRRVRERKKSDSHSWHETNHQAAEAILMAYDEKIEKAQRRLESLKKSRHQFKSGRVIADHNELTGGMSNGEMSEEFKLLIFHIVKGLLEELQSDR